MNWNASWLTGALDVIAVQHDDGTIVSTSFHVRFGRLSTRSLKRRQVRVYVNGEVATELLLEVCSTERCACGSGRNYSGTLVMWTTSYTDESWNPVVPF